MKNSIRIENVHFVEAKPQDVETGLLGWIRCLFNDSIVMDGLTLRRKKNGSITISYPGRRDSIGNIHHFLRPTDDAARYEIERQIFMALGHQVGAK